MARKTLTSLASGFDNEISLDEINHTIDLLIAERERRLQNQVIISVTDACLFCEVCIDGLHFHNNEEDSSVFNVLSLIQNASIETFDLYNEDDADHSIYFCINRCDYEKALEVIKANYKFNSEKVKHIVVNVNRNKIWKEVE